MCIDFSKLNYWVTQGNRTPPALGAFLQKGRWRKEETQESWSQKFGVFFQGWEWSRMDFFFSGSIYTAASSGYVTLSDSSWQSHLSWRWRSVDECTPHLYNSWVFPKHLEEPVKPLANPAEAEERVKWQLWPMSAMSSTSRSAWSQSLMLHAVSISSLATGIMKQRHRKISRSNRYPCRALCLPTSLPCGKHTKERAPHHAVTWYWSTGLNYRFQMRTVYIFLTKCEGI